MRVGDQPQPRDGVRFIHEARNDKEKAELFEAARTGKVSVLIGSTNKMGVGTNVQARAVALHHLDCPWRPADLAQRDGRALDSMPGRWQVTSATRPSRSSGRGLARVGSK